MAFLVSLLYYPGMSTNTVPVEDGWRQTHLGRLLGLSMRRFDERVLQLMASNVDVPLALSNLAARGQVSAAHIPSIGDHDTTTGTVHTGQQTGRVFSNSKTRRAGLTPNA